MVDIVYINETDAESISREKIRTITIRKLANIYWAVSDFLCKWNPKFSIYKASIF